MCKSKYILRGFVQWCKKIKSVSGGDGMANESKIKGLGHITFIYKNLDKTASLFKKVFNAEESYSSDEKFFLSRENFLL